MDILETKLNTATLSAIGSAYNDRYAIAFIFTDGTAYITWNTGPLEHQKPDYERSVAEITDKPIPTSRPVANRDLEDLLEDLAEDRPQLISPDIVVEEIAPEVVADLFNQVAPTAA